MRLTGNNPLILLVVVLALVVAVASGCGEIKLDELGIGKDSRDLSNIGLKPDPSWHGQYLEGEHARFACGDCHVSVARTGEGKSPFREISGDQVCANCHMGEYNRKTRFNHSEFKIGTYCNSCHFSTTFRFSSRPNHSKYHHVIDSFCAYCHPNKTPGGHRADGRTTNCETCHSYPNWAAAGFNHSGVSSGCANCHARHYAGTPCEACHTFGISWGFSHNSVRNDGCAACPGSDGHGNGGWDD